MNKAAILNYVQEVDSDLLTDRRSYNLEGVIFLGKILISHFNQPWNIFLCDISLFWKIGVLNYMFKKAYIIVSEQKKTLQFWH